MRGRNDGRYDQFEISPETIEQKLRPAVCERWRRETDKFKENHTIDLVVSIYFYLQSSIKTIYLLLPCRANTLHACTKYSLHFSLQTLDLNEELQETISQNAMDVGEPALDELEEELEMILQGEGKTATPPRSMVAPPRRIVSPPSGMRVPHQELVNSLCQMKVLDKSGEYLNSRYTTMDVTSRWVGGWVGGLLRSRHLISCGHQCVYFLSCSETMNFIRSCLSANLTHAHAHTSFPSSLF